MWGSSFCHRTFGTPVHHCHHELLFVDKFWHFGETASLVMLLTFTQSAGSCDVLLLPIFCVIQHVIHLYYPSNFWLCKVWWDKVVGLPVPVPSQSSASLKLIIHENIKIKIKSVTVYHFKEKLKISRLFHSAAILLCCIRKQVLLCFHYVRTSISFYERCHNSPPLYMLHY